MTQFAYKRKDLYDDVRACIREGMTIKETSDLCGCSEVTVANWTKDVRDYTPRRKRLSQYQLLQLRKDYEESDMTLAEIAEKYNYTNGQSITQIASRNGWLMRGRGRKSMKGGIVANCIDINEIEAITDKKVREAKERDNEQEITLESVLKERDEKSKPVDKKFKNMIVSFDGDFASYKVQINDELKILTVVDVARLKIADIRKFADELIEIANQYEGGV